MSGEFWGEGHSGQSKREANGEGDRSNRPNFKQGQKWLGGAASSSLKRLGKTRRSKVLGTNGKRTCEKGKNGTWGNEKAGRTWGTPPVKKFSE